MSAKIGWIAVRHSWSTQGESYCLWWSPDSPASVTMKGFLSTKALRHRSKKVKLVDMMQQPTTHQSDQLVNNIVVPSISSLFKGSVTLLGTSNNISLPGDFMCQEGEICKVIVIGKSLSGRVVVPKPRPGNRELSR